MTTQPLSAILTLIAGIAFQAMGQNDSYPILHTLDGHSYTNAEVSSVSASYLTVLYDGGGSRIPLTNLPSEIQARYLRLTNVQADIAADAANEAAKRTLGALRRIHLLGAVWGDYIEISASNTVTQAYIHNLPPVLLKLLRDINETKSRIDLFSHQYASDSAMAARRGLGFVSGGVLSGTGRVSPAALQAQGASLVAANNEAGAAEAARAAAARAAEEYAALQNAQGQFAAYKEALAVYESIVARPSAYLIRGTTRQWEYTDYTPITGAFGWTLGKPRRTSNSTNDLFSDTSVQTASNGTVSQIRGVSALMDSDSAGTAFEETKTKLATKYGPAAMVGTEPPPVRFWNDTLQAVKWARFCDGEAQIDLCLGSDGPSTLLKVEIDYVKLDSTNRPSSTAEASHRANDL